MDPSPPPPSRSSGPEPDDEGPAATSDGTLCFDPAEQVRQLGHLLTWAALGSAVGAVSGCASAGFLATLGWVTDRRVEHGWLLFLLPVAGFVVGLAYHLLGGASGAGNNLIIDEIHDPKAWVPRRMAPLVYGGTILTHLVGGSAGREGTAIQMAGSLTDGLSRLFRIDPERRRVLLIAAIAGGFGSVFGVPLAGCVFALEVQSIGRIRYDALAPTLAASVVGDLVVRAWGVDHTPLPRLAAPDLDAPLLLKVLLAGVVFGLVAMAFSELTHGIRHLFGRALSWPPLRPALGGVLVIALTELYGTRAYNGLSVPLITASMAGGAGIVAAAFALKLLLTSVTLGSGFQGGEVTPLFVIGATLGVTLGRVLGVPVELMAGIGFVAVFAGATNTPLACTIMGVELFGAGPVVPLAIACTASYAVSSHRGIYTTQRIGTPKRT